MPTTMTADQEQLELLEEKRSAMVEAMGKIICRFVTQVADELPQRWEQMVRLFITERPHEAMAQGSEGLARLKRELHRLQARAHAVATEHLDSPGVWRHAEASTGRRGPGYQGNGAPLPAKNDPHRWSRVSDAMSRAESEALCLLRPIFGEDDGPWLRERGRLSAPMEQMIEAYNRLAVQLEELESERTALSRQIASEEAQRLWDEA